MSQTDSLLDPSYVLTLEEIGNLAAEGGKPAETLMNVVALIAAGFRPMSVRPICWNRTAPTSCWPRRSDFALNASALFAWHYTKVSRAWWRKRCVRWPWSR